MPKQTKERISFLQKNTSQLKARPSRVTYAAFLSLALIASGFSNVLIQPSAQAASSLVGEYSWEHQVGAQKGLIGDALAWSDVASSVDGTKLAAAVEDGYIFTSNDSGETWTKRTSAGKREWKTIAANSDGTRLVAATDDLIYTSNDSGATWVERLDPGYRTWNAAAMSADGNVIVVAPTDYDIIVMSTDGGVTWTEQYGAGPQYWSDIAISADGTKIAATASGTGGIYTSIDSGTSWTAQPSVASLNWSQITMSADGMKLAAIVYGESVYTSSDGGVAWTERYDINTLNYASITSNADGTRLTVAIFSGGVVRSEDSGVTWNEVENISNGYWLNPKSDASGDKLVMTLDDGSLFTSIDAGANWTERTVESSRVYSDVAMSDDGTVLVAGTRGASAYYSLNAGATWQEWNAPAAGAAIVGVAVSGDGTVMAAVDSGSNGSNEGYVYISTDQGVTWQAQTALGSQRWSSTVPVISMSYDGSTIVIGDSNGSSWTGGSVYITHDGGATWAAVDALGAGEWSAVEVSDDGQHIAIGNGIYTAGHLYTSSDAGATWTENEYLGPQSWKSIALSADGSKLAVLLNGYLMFVSSDSGDTWAYQPISGLWETVFMDDSGMLLTAVSSDGYVATSSDGGANWSQKQYEAISGVVSIASTKTANRMVTITSDRLLYIGALTQPSFVFNPVAGSSAVTAPASTNSASPQVITNVRPTFTGVTYPNGPVTVTVNSDPIVCSTIADSAGNWSCMLPSDIPVGVHTVTIQLTNPLNGEVETMGPYYISVLDNVAATVISNTSVVPGAPNTGIYVESETTPVSQGVSSIAAAGLVFMLLLASAAGMWRAKKYAYEKSIIFSK